jgi:hypothetical protein
MELPQTKTCPACGETKPASCFYKNASQSCGLDGYCKICKKRLDTSQKERCSRSNKRNNPRSNAVASIAAGIAGTQRAIYKLTKPQRLALWSRARELYRLGVHIQGAAAREASRVREGFVYVIRNDAWPDRLKIGSAVDAESRLANAQTWDPHRRFYVAHSVFVPDRIASEHRVHARLSDYRLEGEWFAVPLPLARAALDEERETPAAQDRHDVESADRV